MICEINVKRFCNEDISKIENYEKAISSSERYDCHHKLEIQDDRIVSKEELISQNLYYNRPASELIFLTHGEHAKLHVKNLKEDTRDKMSYMQQNMKFFTNGQVSTKALECPEGFVPGRLKYYSKGNTGMKWYNNGTIQINCYPEDCPKGFFPGQLPFSEKHKKNISKSREQLMKNPEYIKKLSEANKGKKYYTNGVNNIVLNKDEPCPDGYWRGMTKRKKQKLPKKELF